MENKVYQVFISRKAEKFIEKLSEPHYIELFMKLRIVS